MLNSTFYVSKSNFYTTRNKADHSSHISFIVIECFNSVTIEKINRAFSLAKKTISLQHEEQFSYNLEQKMWTVLIRDQTAHSVQSDLDLHFPQKLPVSSSVKKR